jgi:hypothetical protein
MNNNEIRSHEGYNCVRNGFDYDFSRESFNFAAEHVERRTTTEKMSGERRIKKTQLGAFLSRSRTLFGVSLMLARSGLFFSQTLLVCFSAELHFMTAYVAAA